ncbi:MAG TPA: SDR family oxidoreductase [Longimicrobiales bacterium]|nr:SDR family oxidoreductase [Longimicrobiales bacterium]
MTRQSRIAAVALAGGIALGITLTVGTARLVYAGGGFLGATGVLVALTLAALGAGAWGGDPLLNPDANPRVRALALALALAVAAAFAGLWRGAVSDNATSGAGALGAMLMLAAPAYMAGSLFVALGMRGPSIAPLAIGGAAIGVLFASNAFVPLLQPWSALLLAGSLVGLVGPLAPGETGTRRGRNDMDGRVVIVTGVGDAGQVGYAIAARLLAAGARVVITARSSSVQQHATSLGSDERVIAVEADLTLDDGAERVVAAARDSFGRLDALVNAAGGLRVTGPVSETSDADWRDEHARNVATAACMTRAALPLLRESRGAIVNFASPAADSAPANLGAYAAAKAGVVALTQALAAEERESGVRVNAVAPGMVDTVQNRNDMPTRQRWVKREQIADVVLFLLSDAASGVTGEVVRVTAEMRDAAGSASTHGRE